MDIPSAFTGWPARKLTICTLKGPADFRQAEGVQRAIWGFCDLDIVPATLISAMSNFGGQTLGARYGEKLVAIALSFGSVESRHAHLHSHLVGVLPAYQNRGLGRLVKLAQRDDALQRGIEKIVWTFDPLQVKNAYFNLIRLGCIGVQYLPDLYGKTSSPLHGNMPTDRVAVEWVLNNLRVISALNGNPRKAAHDSVRVELPAMTGEVSMDSRLAAQAKLRGRLMGLLSDGYAITGIELSGDIASYVLESKECALEME